MPSLGKDAASNQILWLESSISQNQDQQETVSVCRFLQIYKPPPILLCCQICNTIKALLDLHLLE